MYGFRKVTQEVHSTCFAHPSFYRGGRKLIGTIKRKMPKKDSSTDEATHKQLEETIEKFNNRIAQLEQRDKDYEWLKAECNKLQ